MRACTVGMPTGMHSAPATCATASLRIMQSPPPAFCPPYPHPDPACACVCVPRSGPGCSGIGTGLMSGGYGPFAAALPNGTLLRNPWSWTTVANVIYLDQPLFTGFSTSSNPDDRRTSGSHTGGGGRAEPGFGHAAHILGTAAGSVVCCSGCSHPPQTNRSLTSALAHTSSSCALCTHLHPPPFPLQTTRRPSPTLCLFSSAFTAATRACARTSSSSLA
jgi:Serine carboxypeptidase